MNNTAKNKKEYTEVWKTYFSYIATLAFASKDKETSDELMDIKDRLDVIIDKIGGEQFDPKYDCEVCQDTGEVACDETDNEGNIQGGVGTRTCSHGFSECCDSVIVNGRCFNCNENV